MTHKELTKHLRNRLAKAGVPCRVRMSDGCEGAQSIQVITPSYEARWTAAQLAQIGLIAECNRLTMARGLPIDRANLAQLTESTQINFYVAQEVAA